MKKTIHYLSTILIAVIALLGVSYVQANWSDPTAIAPNGNTPAPINVSINPQVKTGGLSLGSLIVNGGADFYGPIKITTGAGDKKVLTSDASGNATWQTNTSNDVFASQCSVASTNINHKAPDYTDEDGKRYWKVSLLNSAGRNVCEGTTYGSKLNSGCSYTLWRLKSDGDISKMDQTMYGSTNYFLRQLPGIGHWTDDKGLQRGINGDYEHEYFVNWGNNLYLYDDFSEGTFIEKSKNEWVMRADNQNYVWTVSVCPAM